MFICGWELLNIVVEKSVYFINAHREKLVGTLHIPDRKTGCGVVLGHCFTCSRHTGILREISSFLCSQGFYALRFDFSGNGQSEGDFSRSTYSKQISDMKTAVEFLSSKGVAWIGLCGHSMGAVISLLASSRIKDIKAVCMLAGRLSQLNAAHFLSPQQSKELSDTGWVKFNSRGRSLQLSTDFFADAENFNLSKVLQTLKLPLLVVHGDQDMIIPVRDAYRANELNPDKIQLTVIPGADHMFSDKEHRLHVADLIVNWFQKHAFSTSEKQLNVT